MAGQGSLRQIVFRWNCNRLSIAVLCLFSWTTAAPTTARCQDLETGRLDVRLACRWSAPDAQRWTVRLSVTDPHSNAGSISELANHSESDQTTGAFEVSADGQSILFQPRHAIRGGAMQFRIQASRQASLSIEVSANASHGPNKSSAPTRKLSLLEIVESGQAASDPAPAGSTSGEPTWTITRAVGDEIRIENIAKVPIYEPGASLNLRVHCNALLQHASQPLDLQYSLYRLRDGETVETQRWPITVDPLGNSDIVSIEKSAPLDAGVYEVRCEVAARDEKLWARLRRQGPPLARVARPIIVHPSQPPTSTDQDSAAWKLVGEIRPSETTWSVGKWLPKQTTRFIPGSTAHRTDQDSLSELDNTLHEGEPVSLIPPNATFQATLPVLSVGLPHQVTVRYPGDRAADMQLDVSRFDSRDAPAASLKITSDRSDNPKWKTHTFVYYPTGDDQVWIKNLNAKSPVAFESVVVRAGPYRLSTETPLRAGGRLALIRVDGFGWVDAIAGDVSRLAKTSGCDPSTIDLYRLRISTLRLADYVQALGMNGIVVSANDRGRTWFESSRMLARRGATAIEPQGLATVLRLLQSSKLQAYVALRPNMLLANIESRIRQRPELTGQLTHAGVRQSNQYNLLQPLVQDELASVTRELDQQCSAFANYAGLALHCDTGSHLQSQSNAIRDDGTLARFAESKGKSVDIPALRAWASQAARSEFDHWMIMETHRAYERISSAAGGNKTLMIVQTGDANGSDPGFVKPGSMDQGSNQQESLETLALSRSTRDGVLLPAALFPLGPDHILAQRSSLQQRLASVPASLGGSAVILEHPDVRAGQVTRLREDLSADLSRVIDQIDPPILILDRAAVAPMLPDDLRKATRFYVSMPAAAMREIPPSDPGSQTVRVKSGTKQGRTFVSITSLVPWTSEVDLETVSPVDWVPADAENISPDDRSIRQVTGTRVRVTIGPGQLTVIKSKTKGAHVAFQSYTARVKGGSEALEQIKQNVTSIVERIGILSEFETYDALTNGGFERTGGMGLVGWLHAQHPPGCVRIDDSEFIQGQHSVRLTTDVSAAARTWIVSETIDPPRSGRLAVSLACRAEQKNDDSQHLLRVSIEATRNSEPIRFSSEFNVPRNGQWGSRDVVLEADGIEGINKDSLRLTVDSLSSGRVWIDDVRLHHDFPTANERAELQSQAFLAVQGLRKGNLSPSGKLLQNHWALRLLAINAVEPPAKSEQAGTKAEESPGVAERIRSWLPRPLRF